MTWDPLQREMLQALGHTLYALAGAPGPGPTTASAEAVVSAAPAASAPDATDPLLRAMLRAAGREPHGADAAALCRDWPPAERLRDPAAKRSMWPRLRTLRAQLRGR